MSKVVEVGKKLNIQFENGTETDYQFDFVMTRFENSAIGVIYETADDENSRHTYNIKGYSVKDGSLLFNINKVNHYHCLDSAVIIEKEKNKLYVYFDNLNKVYGPFYNVESVYNNIIVTKRIKVENIDTYVKGMYTYLGEVIVPIKYDDIVAYSDFIIAIKNSKKGMFSYYGGCYVPVEYDSLEPIVRDGLIKYLTIHSAATGKYGVIDKNGCEIIPTKYSNITYMKKMKVFIVEKNGLYGIYDSAGNEVYSPIFSCCKDDACAPLIFLEIGNDIFYYWPAKNELISQKCIKFLKNKIKYFDGKRWITEKTNSNNN